MNIGLVRYDGTHLYPSSVESADNWERLRRDDEYVMRLEKSRNPKYHRKVMALVRAMYDSQEEFEDEDAFRFVLSKAAHFYKEYVTKSGEVVYVPKSWSFADTDDLEFRELHNKLLTIAAKRFGDDFAERFI